METAAELLGTFRLHSLSAEAQEDILKALHRIGRRDTTHKNCSPDPYQIKITLLFFLPEAAQEEFRLGGLVPKTERTLKERGETVLPSRADVEYKEYWIDTSSLRQLQQKVVVTVGDIPWLIQTMLDDKRIPNNHWYARMLFGVLHLIH